MAGHRLSLLGGFEMAGSEAPADLTRKGRGLLAFLALNQQLPQSRERLADLFWSRSDQEQARTSVRQTLSKLRRVLSSEQLGQIVTERDLVALRLDDTTLDVEEFRELIARGGPGELEVAVSLYRGDLLEGLGVEEEPFDEWLRGERESLRIMAIEALERLAEHYHHAGELSRCVVTATRLLQLDPLREDIHRLLMKVYATQGRNGLALKQFENCREIMLEQLGVQPERETLELYRQLRERRFKPSAQPNGTDEPRLGLLAEAARFPIVSSTTWREEELALEGKPSVAVLPFESAGGSDDDSYFAFGITENIITELSKFRELLVIGAKSAAIARNAGASVEEIARHLGVAHVVDGSVARVGDRVRVTAQLISATTGQRVWAEHFDRMLGDIFSVQDEIANMIAAVAAQRLEGANYAAAVRKPAVDMVAYDYILRARHSMRQYTKQGELTARADLDRAISLDPASAEAHACYANSYIHEFESVWSEDYEAARHNAFEMALKAVALDENYSAAHRALGYAAHYNRRCELAERELERAFALNRNEYSNCCVMGWIYIFSNRQEAGLRYLASARRINPVAAENCMFSLATAYLTSGRFEEAIDAFNRMHSWDAVRLACLAAAHARLGEPELAKALGRSLGKVIQTEFAGAKPDPVARWRKYIRGVLTFHDRGDEERLFDGMRLAEIPI